MIAIMVDSAAGISRQEAEELGAYYVPMTYTFGQKQYAERYLGENGRFEPYIGKEELQRKTSQASLSAFIKAYEKQIAKGRQVLCITISSRLSGTYPNAVMAANEVNADMIKVLDSRNCAGGVYFLIVLAKRLIKEGKTLDEILDILIQERKNIHNVFTVNDMTNLRNSGRLGVVRQSVSTILNLRPILYLQQGSIYSDGTARGSQEQMKKLVEIVDKKREIHCNSQSHRKSIPGAAAKHAAGEIGQRPGRAYSQSGSCADHPFRLDVFRCLLDGRI